MDNYSVVVINKIDEKPSLIFLKEYDDVVKLIQNLETKLYRLGAVKHINEPVFFDITPFVIKDSILEMGQ